MKFYAFRIFFGDLPGVSYVREYVTISAKAGKRVDPISIFLTTQSLNSPLESVSCSLEEVSLRLGEAAVSFSTPSVSFSPEDSFLRCGEAAFSFTFV